MTLAEVKNDLTLEEVFRLNDALSVSYENERRAQEAAERAARQKTGR